MSLRVRRRRLDVEDIFAMSPRLSLFSGPLRAPATDDTLAGQNLTRPFNVKAADELGGRQ